MRTTRQPFAVLCVIFLMATLLLACGTSEKTPAAEMRTYKDYVGHTVEIPVHPKRVIFSGETYGDLLALGVQAVGYPLSMGEDQVFEDKLQGVEDVGFPINLEKTLELQPDLIIYAGTDEAEAWLASYSAKNAAMWQRLYSGILQPGETASALIYDHGNHLFAMGMSGLSTALYTPGGL